MGIGVLATGIHPMAAARANGSHAATPAAMLACNLQSQIKISFPPSPEQMSVPCSRFSTTDSSSTFNMMAGVTFSFVEQLQWLVIATVSVTPAQPAQPEHISHTNTHLSHRSTHSIIALAVYPQCWATVHTAHQGHALHRGRIH
ncbi:hypothetical protein EYF80_007734 [Liparis tanakae]|uniref:Uncharacterized protein n=1 Tax=Liparis tanakae TaxID=230148 RepID=A0A4Z2IX43_9TELE|nr:hypothetical protein EYF80_007734 [Liparis tanakae]